MSSRCNYSLSQLFENVKTRRRNLIILHKKRFEAQQARLLQFPDQTGVLTAEQQGLNKRVEAVSDDFEAALDILNQAKWLVDDYEHTPSKDQPKLRGQIEALFAEVSVKLPNLEGRVRELEGIDVTDEQ